MIEASEVSLKSTIICVTSDGTMLRIACGSTTNRIDCARVRPSAVAASTWPRGTDWMPARTISPKYAASKMTKAASGRAGIQSVPRSEEHTSELQSRQYLVCRLLLEKKKRD